jgi:hypothetical protein
MESSPRVKRNYLKVEMQLDLKSIVLTPQQAAGTSGKFNLSLTYSSDAACILSCFFRVTEDADPIYNVTQE